MLIQVLDIVRMLIVAAAFYFGYNMGYASGTYDPAAQLHFMIPVIIAAIAGISGIEGLFFGKAAAEAKGFESGSNYQKQSAIALLSYAIVAVAIYFLNWGVKAELTIFFTFICFFFFSGINHGIDAVRRRNYKWQNINRPVITLLLIAGMLYPVIMALKALN